MATVKNENFVVIQGWMVAELGLSGAELVVYAVIYGFSQDGQWFSGSQRYLAAWAGISRRQVLNVLAALERKNLIEKKAEISPNKVRHCLYRCALSPNNSKQMNDDTDDIIDQYLLDFDVN